MCPFKLKFLIIFIKQPQTTSNEGVLSHAWVLTHLMSGGEANNS